VVVRVSDRSGDDQTPLNLLLRQRGYQVQTLSASYLNPAIVEASQADLVLLDMMTPDRGSDLCQTLKSYAGTQSLPIMMLSTVHSAADRAKAFKAGVVDYITQPTPPDEIVVRVETHLSRSRHCRQMEAQVLVLKSALEVCQAQVQRDQKLLDLMQQVLDRQGDYGLLIDEGNRILYANSAAAEALEYPREVLLSMGMEQLDLRLTEQDWAMVWQHLKEYRTLFLESVHTCQSGTTLAVQLDLQHLLWGDRAYGYIAVQKR
jgi:response regulator RpfG family c-di-GMP phosphodiesterase